MINSDSEPLLFVDSAELLSFIKRWAVDQASKRNIVECCNCKLTESDNGKSDFKCSRCGGTEHYLMSNDISKTGE